MGGVAKEYITKLECEKYFGRESDTEHPWRCSITHTHKQTGNLLWIFVLFGFLFLLVHLE
jgi:hypothetical protein